MMLNHRLYDVVIWLFMVGPLGLSISMRLFAYHADNVDLFNNQQTNKITKSNKQNTQIQQNDIQHSTK